jgi:hypothetical protein
MRTVELSLLLTAAASVCLAQYPHVPSNADSYCAHVVSQTGQVSLYKDSRLIPLSTGDQVQVTQTIVSGADGHATLQVSDGSTIEVLPNSELVFRKNTGDWKDLVDLIIGRIRVHIEHWGNQPNPNRIMTPTAVISVRGTTFDVSVDEDDETTEVDVEEGTVVVQHALLPSSREATLHTGESIKIYKNVGIASSGLDKSTIAKYVLQILRDVAVTMGGRTPKLNIPGGGGGLGDGCKPGVPGCSGSAPPPPPTTLPTPPPPPPLVN